MIAWHVLRCPFPHHCAAPLFLFFGATHPLVVCGISPIPRGNFHCSLELHSFRVGDQLSSSAILSRTAAVRLLPSYHVARNGTETDPLLSFSLLLCAFLSSSSHLSRHYLGRCYWTLIYITAATALKFTFKTFSPLASSSSLTLLHNDAENSACSSDSGRPSKQRYTCNI